MISIENDDLMISVNLKGGSLTSIYDKKREKELLYHPRKESWQGQDVFIFPFIARIQNQTYTHNGNEYHLKNHGLLRYMEGKGEEGKGICSVSFHSDEETLKQYPFQFEAKATYELHGKELVVTYHIRNLSDEDMPYMVGGHPAFMLPGVERIDEFDISGNYITFNEKTKLTRITQEETCSFNTGEVEYGIVDRISLSKEMFRHINTYIFKGEGFKEVKLHKLDGSSLTLKKNDSQYLALWSGNAYGNYIAIEPWNGIPDYLDSGTEIRSKKGIRILKPLEKTDFSYSIIID